MNTAKFDHIFLVQIYNPIYRVWKTMSTGASPSTISDTFLAIKLKIRKARESPDVKFKDVTLDELEKMFDTNDVLHNLSTLFDNYSMPPLPYPADADWRMTH